MKIKCIPVLSIALFHIDAFGHVQKVHEAITVNAAEESPSHREFSLAFPQI